MKASDSQINSSFVSSETRKKKVIYLGFTFTLLVLIAAWQLDWEYDEAWSYFAVSRNSFASLLAYTEFTSANHHLFNSLYFRLLQVYNFTHPFYFRMLSILGFGLFLFASLRIFKMLGIKMRLLPLVLLAPYFVYFSLARGYSLALGAYCMSLMYLLSFYKENKVRKEWLFFIFSAISSISVFSFLFGFLGLLSIYFFLIRNSLFRITSWLIAFGTLLILAYVYYAGKIINNSDPYIIGSNQLFRNGTISSIVSDFSHYNELHQWTFYSIYKPAVAVSLLLPFLYLASTYIRKKFNPEVAQNEAFIIIVGILLPLLYMILAHQLTDAKYPMVRSVSYIYFLLLLLLSYTLARFPKSVPLLLAAATLLLGSLTQLGSYYYSLRLPNIESVLKITGGNTLYIVDHDPNIQLTNRLSQINKHNIQQQRHARDINALITVDSAVRVYLLCHPDYIDSFQVKSTRVCDTRFGKSLYCIEK